MTDTTGAAGKVASTLHSDVERQVRKVLKNYVFDQPAIQAVVRALDLDTVEFIHDWLPRAVGYATSFLPTSLFGSTSLAHLIRGAAQETGKESANMIKEGQEVSAEKIGEILAAKLKEVGDRMVEVDEFGHVHLSCDGIGRVPYNRKRKITLAQAVEQKRVIAPCCTDAIATVTMPPEPPKNDFRSLSVIEKLEKIEALAQLNWIKDLDKVRRDRVVGLIQESSSEVELEGALERISAGDDIEQVAAFMEDCNPSVKARRNVANAIGKVTEAALALAKAFDASLALKVTELRQRVERNREAKSWWNRQRVERNREAKSWWNRNKGDLASGAVIIGLMVSALLFFR